MSYDTRAQTLDPGKTMVVFQALARPEGHWPRVEAMQRRRRRERHLANALLGMALTLAAIGLWAWAMTWIGG